MDHLTVADPVDHLTIAEPVDHQTVAEPVDQVALAHRQLSSHKMNHILTFKLFFTNATKRMFALPVHLLKDLVKFHVEFLFHTCCLPTSMPVGIMTSAFAMVLIQMVQEEEVQVVQVVLHHHHQVQVAQVAQACWSCSSEQAEHYDPTGHKKL